MVAGLGPPGGEARDSLRDERRAAFGCENDTEDALPLSTLLVSLRVGSPNEDLLAVVVDVARRFGSRVVGVAARQVTAHAFVRGAGPFEPSDYDPRRFLEQAEIAEREFRDALSRAGALDWRVQMTSGPASDFVANEARSADLVIAPLDGRERGILPAGRAEVGDLMMRLGRLLLTAPSGVAGLAFRQALVCFKDVREARRALADSLPLLQAMERVHVVEIAEGGIAGTRGDASRTWRPGSRRTASRRLSTPSGAAKAPPPG